MIKPKRYTRSKQLAFLAKHQTSEVIVDIGAGTNPLYSSLFPKRIRIDIDSEKKPDIVASVTDLPFEDNSQTHILCSEIFEHLPDPTAAAAELYRVTKPGGQLILTTRMLYPLHNLPDDYWRFTPTSMKALFSSWNILALEYEARPMYAVGIILQRIGFQTDMRGGKVTKAFIYALAWLFTKLDWLVIREYAEINKISEAEGVFSTGIYLVLSKPEVTKDAMR